ncbi:hypothetical protein GN244_ATG02504 [Phytophthora infestans]|uniref:Uncharacterized protein n=1 Tax=Phytophthora infestans TaxID=4787 RepID=A0A833TEQ3_PHYIN|nr:hypothetical protein GN244_ATG02504 [Phytophthora infestans]
MVTGDRYPKCEPQLSQYCCKCENDNLAISIFFRKCREREIASEKADEIIPSMHTISRSVAKKKLGFSNIPETSRESELYDRDLLGKHMLERCGSKMGWLSEIAAQDAKRRLRSA